MVGYGLGKYSTGVFGKVVGTASLPYTYETLRYNIYVVRYEVPVDVYRHPTLG